MGTEAWRSELVSEVVLCVDGDGLGEGLRALLRGEALAVRCPEYQDLASCEALSERVLGHHQMDHYTLAPSIGKLGTPYYDTCGSPPREARYWAQARRWNEQVREAFGPWLSPIDKVRLALDEQWPGGVRLLRDSDQRPAFAGLARAFLDGAEALPHTDRLEWDAPQARFTRRPRAQVAVNTYLKMPEEGGELALWWERPTRAEYERLRLAGSYGLDEAKLPAPALTLRPQAGELVFFDAQRIHAVRASGGERVTVSFFIVVDAQGAAFLYS